MSATQGAAFSPGVLSRQQRQPYSNAVGVYKLVHHRPSWSIAHVLHRVARVAPGVSFSGANGRAVRQTSLSPFAVGGKDNEHPSPAEFNRQPGESEIKTFLTQRALQNLVFLLADLGRYDCGQCASV